MGVHVAKGTATNPPKVVPVHPTKKLSARTPASICTVTIPAKKREHREVFHVANDVMSGEMTQAIRDALRNAAPGKDVTFNVSVQ